jgi:hypothetical protein
MGPHTAALELGVHQTFGAQLYSLARGNLAALMLQGQMTLQTNTVLPSGVLIPSDQSRRYVEPVRCQHPSR